MKLFSNKKIKGKEIKETLPHLRIPPLQVVASPPCRRCHGQP